jgi:hypothetical protein
VCICSSIVKIYRHIYKQYVNYYKGYCWGCQALPSLSFFFDMVLYAYIKIGYTGAPATAARRFSIQNDYSKNFPIKMSAIIWLTPSQNCFTWNNFLVKFFTREFKLIWGFSSLWNFSQENLNWFGKSFSCEKFHKVKNKLIWDFNSLWKISQGIFI